MYLFDLKDGVFGEGDCRVSPSMQVPYRRWEFFRCWESGLDRGALGSVECLNRRDVATLVAVVLPKIERF